MIAAVALFYGSFHYLRLKRFMDNTPTSKARSVAMGMVEMAGTCRRAYNLLAPMAQVPCVFFRLRKYRREKRYNNQAYSWVLKSDTSSRNVPFYLKDDTGMVMIDPAGANVKPSRSQTIAGGWRTPWGDRMTVPDDIKYVEEIIPEGTGVYVLGFATPTQMLRRPLRQRVAEKLRRLKQDKTKMAAYDTDKDGRIDETEWNAARADVERQALEDSLEENQTPVGPEKRVVIQKPEIKGLPFVIAQSSEKSLTRSYVLVSALMFLGAIIGSVVGILQMFFG